MKVTPQELAIRQAWPLDYKIQWAVNRLADFIIHTDGQCYLTFSGGKDSRTVKDLIDGIYDGRFRHLLPPHIYTKILKFPKPINVFANTGLEFPEIVDYVKTFEGVVIVKPRMGFVRVLREIGVAVGTKKTAMMVSRLKGYIANPSPKNEATKNLYLTGYKKDGTYSEKSKLPNRWMKLLDAPFEVSDQCCDIFKKEPFRKYEDKTGSRPIIGTTVNESDTRKVSYLKTGCNSFECGKEKSRPISIFTEADIWEYADRFQIQHCSVYYDRTIPVEQLDGSFKIESLKAEKSTGCTFCFFGLHLNKKGTENRIQRLAISHPKYYHIIIYKCEVYKIFEWLKIPYKPNRNACCAQKTLFDIN